MSFQTSAYRLPKLPQDGSTSPYLDLSEVRKKTLSEMFSSNRNFQIFFFYCCSSTVVSIFPPPLSLAPPTPTSHPPSFPLLALSMGPLYMFLDDLQDQFSPSFPLSPKRKPNFWKIEAFIQSQTVSGRTGVRSLSPSAQGIPPDSIKDLQHVLSLPHASGDCYIWEERVPQNKMCKLKDKQFAGQGSFSSFLGSSSPWPTHLPLAPSHFLTSP